MSVDPNSEAPPYAVADSPPRKVAAGALFFDSMHRVLLVKPTYRDGWLVPGGLVDKNESPKQGCTREIREELGLECTLGRLLCLDYTSASVGRDEALKIVFFGGTLSQKAISQIRLPKEELSAFEFFDRTEALARLIPPLDDRVRQSFVAIDENRTLYCENGVESGTA